VQHGSTSDNTLGVTPRRAGARLARQPVKEVAWERPGTAKTLSEIGPIQPK